MEKTGFAEILKEMLADAGINQSDLARRAGVTYQAVQSVIKKDNPSMLVAMNYLDRLGYDVALVRKGKKLPDGSFVLNERRPEAGDQQSSE